MAKIPDSPRLKQQLLLPKAARTSVRVNHFLGSFGRSRGVVPEAEQGFHMDELDCKKKGKIQWFSWSRLNPRKSLRRTVPIDANEKFQNKQGSCGLSRSGKKFSFSRRLQPAKDVDKCPIPASVAVVAEKTSHEKPNMTRYDAAQNIILGKCKSIDHSDSMKKITCKNGSSSISEVAALNGISHSNTSGIEFAVDPATTLPSHLVSKRPLPGKISMNWAGGDSPTNKEEKPQENDGKFDQFVGLSFILVTLAMMIVWGKLCAILSTSAWFYFYPLLLRSKKESNVTREKGLKYGNETDVNSQEHKRKVVLEGFLERNHRKS